MADKRQYIKQREDVVNLGKEIDNLTKKQESFFSSLKTSGDTYKDVVDTSKELAKALQESGKYSKKNNDLAKNQAKVAQLGISLGKRQNIFSRTKMQFELIALKNKRKQQDFEDEITDDLIEQIEAQQEQVSLAKKYNKALSAVDDAFGNMGSTIKDFVTNPMTILTGILTAFGAATDSIGKKFGAIGVTGAVRLL